MWKQVFHDVLLGFLTTCIVKELELSLKEEADRPEPLRTLMVVVAMTGIRVDVVAVILPICWVKRLHAHRAISHQHLLNDLKALLCPFRRKQFRCDCHSNA